MLAMMLMMMIGCGGWLLFSAREIRDDGAPRCFNCSYLLTGLTSDCCPECGAEITDETRHLAPPAETSWPRFILGLLLLLGAFSLAVRVFMPELIRN